MKPRLTRFFLASALLLLAGCVERNRPEVRVDEGAKRVDVTVDGQAFASYVFADTIATLKKPILFPILSARGVVVTRGYPLAPRPGERTDHPHQVGLWLNHGDVNGLDFWNNSDAIPPDEAFHYGTIRHRAVVGTASGPGEGTLTVTADWLRPDDRPLLAEETRFAFYAAADRRVIDRITTLTALEDTVVFRDSKEGMMALRVARALEHPVDQADHYVRPDGSLTDSAYADPQGGTGRYLNSEGIEGLDVWGRRADWVRLTGVVEADTVTLVLFDHPENVGHPTHWMARGYGLFAANPLGARVYSEGREALDFTLPPGASATFRYRLLIQDGRPPDTDTLESAYRVYSESQKTGF